MKKTIEKVQQYFVQKIMNEEYDIVEVDKYFVGIVIDEIYSFRLWTGDSANWRWLTTWGNDETFMQLSFTEHQQETLHLFFTDLQKSTLEDVVRAAKLAKFEELKKELNIKCDQS